MFFKKQPKLDTIIGLDSIMKGDLTSKGTVKVDGQLEGNVAADCLIIGDTGSLTGDVTARDIVVAGRIIGNIQAVEGVDIQCKGEVCGDISSARLTIAEGARFDGRSSMQLQKKIGYSGEGVVASEA